MNYEVNNKKYILKGISEALLSRLITAVKSNKFIGDKPLSIIEVREKYLGSGVRVIRNSYWQIKPA